MPSNARTLASEIFDEVVAAIDGQRLVRAAAAELERAAPTHVLALGKVALPMLAGARAVLLGARPTLAVAPAARALAAPQLDFAPDADIRAADHPLPTERSVAAAEAARAFVARASAAAGHRLLVLLSGGSSSLVCAPVGGLTLDDKRAAIAAVARGGAPIAALNAVRKHLSAIKGGQLALATDAPTTVVALSDVVGDYLSVIGSGPLSPDPSTYADALAAVAEAAARGGGAFPAAARAVLEAGARGARPETPKPGDARLDHVRFQVIAGPARVVAEARRAVELRGLGAGELWRDTERDVVELAEAAIARAAREAGGGGGGGGGGGQVLVGNGEPRIRIPAGAGVGGRATHLALLVARGLRELPAATRGRVAFLAAGTDDRDGNSPAAGAIVDAGTWDRAAAHGVDPEAALRGADSFRALDAAGDALTGPGTSNLLDLHLLVVVE